MTVTPNTPRPDQGDDAAGSDIAPDRYTTPPRPESSGIDRPAAESREAGWPGAGGRRRGAGRGRLCKATPTRRPTWERTARN
jgi:hypothetical protein